MKKIKIFAIALLAFISLGFLFACNNTKSYEVTFKDYDGTVLKEETVIKGGFATPPSNPEREGYDFIGWDISFDDVESDLEVLATYAIKTFTITWKNYDGSILETDYNVEWGTVPSFDGSAPIRPTEDGNIYTFNGFSPVVSKVTDNHEFTANYSSVLDKYTVKFYDANNNVIKEEEISHGSSAIAPSSNPEKEGYEFLSWDKEYSNVKSDLDIYPEFSIKTFTITWKNQDGSVLRTDTNVEWGTMPSYGVSTPIIDSTSSFRYEFLAWDKIIVKAYEDQTYQAEYKEILIIPDGYTLLTDSDFDGTSNGDFIYNGTHEYVVVPEFIKGIKITKTSNSNFTSPMFKNTPNIKGVAFLVPSNITNMTYLFYNNQSASLDLSNLYTKTVIDMSGMFYNSSATNLDLSNFDTSNVRFMLNMFYNSGATTIDLSNLNTSNVELMSCMFHNSMATTLDLSNFDTSKVTDMAYMFEGAKATTINLSSFDTSKVTDMSAMFFDSSATILDLSSFDMSSVTNTTHMFKNSKITTGYARTVADATILNSLVTNVNFIVSGYYRITWKDYNGSFLGLDYIKEGTIPSYEGLAPTKPSTDIYRYDFLEWDKKLIEAYEDQTYQAKEFKELLIIPDGYTLLTDSDFDGDFNGDFMYNGNLEYVVIPEYIKGIKVTRTSLGQENSLFKNAPNIKGVAFLVPSNITDMSFLFYNNKSTSLDLRYLFTTTVTNMNSMFYGSSATSLDLSGFDTRNVISMTNMFLESSALTLDLRSFDTSNVLYMRNMFFESSVLTLDLTNFDTSNVTDMSNMFYGSALTEIDLRSFDLSGVTSISNMFNNSSITLGYARTIEDAKRLNKVTPWFQFEVDGFYIIYFSNHNGSIIESDYFEENTLAEYKGETPKRLSNSIYDYTFLDWSPSLAIVTKSTTYKAVFKETLIIPDGYTLLGDDDFDGNKDGEFLYNGDLEYVVIPEYIKGVKVTKTSIDTYESAMFYNTPNIKGVAFLVPSNITDMSLLFCGNKSEELDLSNLYTESVTNMVNMFQDSMATSLDLSNFDTRNVTNMYAMFASTVMTSLDLWNFDTRNVTDMAYMFYNSGVKSLDLRSFDTSNVTDMSHMFYYCSATSLDISSFNTSNVLNMTAMFGGSGATSLDVSHFNTSNVTDMSSMFIQSNVTVLDVSNFDTAKVTTMNGMFAYTKFTSIDLSNFDTSNVTSMQSMFMRSKITYLDLSNFNTEKLKHTTQMFAWASVTEVDLSSFDMSTISVTSSMFQDITITRGYARTVTDANTLNSLANGIVFVVEGYHIIRFTDSDDSLLKAIYVVDGELPVYNVIPTRQATDKFTYEYLGWDSDLVEATEEKTYKAVYKEILIIPTGYTLLTDSDFNGDKDGEFLYNGNLEYVVIPEYIKGIKVTKTSSRTNATALFYNAPNIKGVAFLVPGNITDMSLLFNQIQSTSLDLKHLYTGSVTNMYAMFTYCKALTLDLTNFDTKNVTDMSFMFGAASALDIDLSSFDTSSVITMSHMFFNTQLSSLDLSNFIFDGVTNYWNIFNGSTVTEVVVNNLFTAMKLKSQASGFLLDVKGYYTIKWINHDGTLLYYSYVLEDTMPSYEGNTPSKESTEYFNYEFIGWDKEIVAATKNETYQATYKEISIIPTT
ncbi:BspA family leucine-rich repeat surface protein [Acholeplasma sp. OttesenSCG-928-E16]|nr:BspA family leucine-rich repeat surface protein [Acholeplasma sp. OttesenSCG-928-E16]